MAVGLLSCLTKPTRVVNEAKSYIDHIYTNNLSYGITPYIMLHDISGHYPIYLTVGKSKIETDVEQMQYSLEIRIYWYHCIRPRSTRSSKFFNIIAVIIFEVNIVDEQRQTYLVTFFLFFKSFHCTSTILLPPPFRCSCVPVFPPVVLRITAT